MAQHFLLSAAARTISLGQVLRMTDAEAEAAFAAIRWPETAGRPVCPGCGCPICYDCRRPSGAARWRCQACRLKHPLIFGGRILLRDAVVLLTRGSYVEQD